MNHPVTLHELGIVGVLKLMPESVRPQVTIVGVEPGTIDYGMELSPSVQASVPRVIQIVQEMITQILSVPHGRMLCGTYMKNSL